MQPYPCPAGNTVVSRPSLVQVSSLIGMVAYLSGVVQAPITAHPTTPNQVPSFGALSTR